MMVGLYKQVEVACDIRSHEGSEGVVDLGISGMVGQLLVSEANSCMEFSYIGCEMR
jgi:hypothetical protein